MHNRLSLLIANICEKVPGRIEGMVTKESLPYI